MLALFYKIALATSMVFSMTFVSFSWNVFTCIAGIPSIPQNSFTAVYPRPRCLKSSTMMSLMANGCGFVPVASTGDEYVLP